MLHTETTTIAFTPWAERKQIDRFHDKAESLLSKFYRDALKFMAKAGVTITLSTAEGSAPATFSPASQSSGQKIVLSEDAISTAPAEDPTLALSLIAAAWAWEEHGLPTKAVSIKLSATQAKNMWKLFFGQDLPKAGKKRVLH
jgi:hypothetical protein